MFDDLIKSKIYIYIKIIMLPFLYIKYIIQ